LQIGRTFLWAAFALLVTALTAVLWVHHRDHEVARTAALRQLAAWGVPAVPSSADAKLVYDERAGESATRIYVEVKTTGGLAQTLATMKCFSYSQPTIEGAAMHRFLSAHMSLPPVEEITACGTCDFDGVTRARFMRFKDRDVIEVEKIAL